MKSTSEKGIVVPPHLTIRERIARCHFEGSIDKLIEEKYSHNPNTVGSWKFYLFAENGIGFDRANDLCSSSGWQAAELDHLLALAESFSWEVRMNINDGYGSVLALGSTIKFGGDQRVPLLNNSSLALTYPVVCGRGIFSYLKVRRIAS